MDAKTPDDARITKLPFWKAWTVKEAAQAFAGPLLVLGAIAWAIYLISLGFGTIFDNDHIGSTVVGTLVAIVAAVIGAFFTSRLLAAVHGIVLEGRCPCCAAVGVRLFENLADPNAPPTSCGRCIAYLRTDHGVMREESSDAVEMIATPYVLMSDQYLPAVQKTNRGYYKFEMPTMCAICGDTNAPHYREIGDAHAMGNDLGALGVIGGIASNLADVPSRQRDQRVGSTSEPSADEENDRALSQLKAPVCEKHASETADLGHPLEYSSGRLKFASYRYYKAFCELNKIERATAVKG